MKTKSKIRKTKKAVLTFINQTIKNFKCMKKKMKQIWLMMFVALFLTATITTACNVTRVVTNESKYYQKGDTAVTITTKTIESYDATKKGLGQ